MTRSPLTDPRPGDVVEAKYRTKTKRRKVLGVRVSLFHVPNCKYLGRYVVEYSCNAGICSVWLSSWQTWCRKHKAKPIKPAT